MENKFATVLGSFKNVNTDSIKNTIKESQKNLKPTALLKVITEKASQAEVKVNSEIEKVVFQVVERILDEKSNNNVTEEVKKEIVSKLTNYNRGKNIFPIFAYVNKTIFKNMPKNMKLNNFKKNVADALVRDAKKSLERKKKVDRK